jgi:hypothetical protein
MLKVPVSESYLCGVVALGQDSVGERLGTTLTAGSLSLRSVDATGRRKG